MRLAFCVLASAALVACGTGLDNLETRFELRGDSEEGRLAVLSALDAWRTATPLVTAGVAEPSGATIEVVEDAPLRGFTDFERGRITVRHTGSFEQTRRVALHELGHWFAWSEDHSADPRDVMFESAKANEPTNADVARLR